MTDKTDIPALRDKHELALKDLTERLTECNRLNFCMDELSAFAAFSSSVIDQLEAERQQREVAETELAELRGEQEPFGYAFDDRAGNLQITRYKPTLAHDHKVEIVELFTRQPKPVAVLPAELDFDCELENGEGDEEEEWLRGRVAGFNEAIKQCDDLMRAAGIVVKDGE